MNEAIEPMKCPSCTLPMKYHFRQKGGVRTHERYECTNCSLSVIITKLEPYISLTDRFKIWLEKKNVKN